MANLFNFFLVDLGFACKVGALLIESQFQSVLLWLFWILGHLNYLLGLASQGDSPDLSHPSS
jgi:hypothetical protein